MNLADSIDGRTNALTVSDVAGLLNISERQVYKLAAENRIPSFRLLTAGALLALPTITSLVQGTLAVGIGTASAATAQEIAPTLQ